jgi:ArsR family transcriptional regulator
VLRPGGRVIVGDMLPHDREGYRQQMGHVWLGFSDERMGRMLTEAGFGRIRIVALAPDTRAKGPGLFAASGQKSFAAGGQEETRALTREAR